MVKSVILYKNVTSNDIFKQYYLDEILPRAKNIKEIIGINITNILQQIRDDAVPSINGVQFIIELYFQSEQTMSELTRTNEGQELLRVLEGKAPGKVIHLLGRQNTYRYGKQKFLYVPRWNSDRKDNT